MRKQREKAGKNGRGQISFFRFFARPALLPVHIAPTRALVPGLALHMILSGFVVALSSLAFVINQRDNR